MGAQEWGELLRAESWSASAKMSPAVKHLLEDVAVAGSEECGDPSILAAVYRTNPTIARTMVDDVCEKTPAAHTAARAWDKDIAVVFLQRFLKSLLSGARAAVRVTGAALLFACMRHMCAIVCGCASDECACAVRALDSAATGPTRSVQYSRRMSDLVTTESRVRDSISQCIACYGGCR
jgi:hypothetical protein